MRTVLVGLLLAAGAVLAVPGTAHACSCVSADARQFVTWADAVATAEVVQVRRPAGGAGLAQYLLEVDGVYKGRVTERTVLRSASSGASCGLEGISRGERHVFFLDRTEGGDWTGDIWGAPSGSWTANLCGGTGAVDEATVQRLIGRGAEPGDGAPAGRGAPVAPDAGGPDRLPPSPYSYAGMGAGVLAAAVVALLAWFRRGAR